MWDFVAEGGQALSLEVFHVYISLHPPHPSREPSSSLCLHVLLSSRSIRSSLKDHGPYVLLVLFSF